MARAKIYSRFWNKTPTSFEFKWFCMFVFPLYIFIVRTNCEFNFNFSMKHNKIYFSHFRIKKKVTFIDFKEKK